MVILDINECGQNNGGCDRFCNNTEGSFFCTCGDGYNLNEDGRQCDGKNLGWCLLMNDISGQQLIATSLMAVVFKQVDTLPALTFYIIENYFRADLV